MSNKFNDNPRYDEEWSSSEHATQEIHIKIPRIRLTTSKPQIERMTSGEKFVVVRK